MAGIGSYYNQVPRFRNIVTPFIIQPVLGSNPVDSGAIRLSNIRGQVTYTITSADNSFVSQFSVVGGIGEFPGEWSRNWYFTPGSNVNCTIAEPQINRIEITTPAGDAGGRKYVFAFVAAQSFGPTVQQTSVNTIGNNNLTVTIQKINIVAGSYA